MKKFVKKILTAALAVVTLGAIAVPMTACSKGQATRIGIMLYKDSGDDVEAIKAFTKSLEKPLNMKFEYVVGSLTKNEDNIKAIGNLQLAGCKGIVVSQCGNTFPGFVDKAAECGMYIASYYGVPEDVYYYDGVNNTGFMISSQTSKDNMAKWYVGGIEDGVRTGDMGGQLLGESFFNNAVVAGGERKIGLMHFNFLYYPKQQVAVDTFITKTNEWNATHTDDKITLFDVQTKEDGTYKLSADFPGRGEDGVPAANETGKVGFSLGFAPINDTYLQDAARSTMTSIVCFGAAGSFVYPKVAAANKSLHIYGSGYDSGSDGYNKDFGTQGAKIMQQSTYTCVETFIYPLVMLANKINGTEFADNYQQKAADNKYLNTDVVDRRVSATYNYITTNAQLDALRSSGMYHTHNAKNALITADQVKNLMLQYNENATYAQLLKTVQGLAYPTK